MKKLRFWLKSLFLGDIQFVANKSKRGRSKKQKKLRLLHSKTLVKEKRNE